MRPVSTFFNIQLSNSRGKSGNESTIGFVSEDDEVIPAFIFLFLSCIMVEEKIDFGLSHEKFKVNQRNIDGYENKEYNMIIHIKRKGFLC